MTGHRGPLLIAFVALLLASTAMFAIGAAIEKNRSANSHSGVSQPSHNEGQEHGQEGEASSPSAVAAEGGTNDGEQILGVNAEGTPLIVLAVLTAVLIAGLTLWQPRVLFLAIGLLYCVAAVVFDIAEVSHQIHEGRSGLAVLAGLVAAMHATAGILALVWIRAHRMSSRAQLV